MNSPIPDKFDPANARELCEASADVYRGVSNHAESVLRCESSAAHVCIQRRTDITRDDGGGDLIIAFRGTADVRDCLTDMDFKLAPSGGFRAHRGFRDALDSIDAELCASLGDTDGMRVWITGHSLGGALAELWALRMAEHGHDIAGVYTFGQPRAGDGAFAAYYDSLLRSQTFRVVHGDDVVPRVPWLLHRYQHAGQEIFFPGGARRWIQNCGWWRKLLFDAAAVVRDFQNGRCSALENHHIANYLALFRSPDSRELHQPS